MKLSLRHTFDCSQETFWKMYWDDDFDKLLNADSEVTREILDEKDDGETLYRRMRFTPKAELPAVAAKILGSKKLIYEQDTHWDRSKSQIRWRVLPTLLPGKLNAEGVFKVTEVGTEKTEMVVTGDIDVNVRFVGGTIEKAVVQQVSQSYDKMAVAMRQWLATHG